MSTHPLSDITVLDQFAEIPFAPGWPTDHRTFNAPTDYVVDAIQFTVGTASMSQVLAMYSYTHPLLIASFVNQVKAGLPSLCVLDSSEFAGEAEQKAIAPLMAVFGPAYPNLRLSVGPAEDGHDIMHRKIWVGDGSIVISGSFNWTESAVKEDNQCTIGIWPSDAALLTASIEATYAYQMANHPQPQQVSAA